MENFVKEKLSARAIKLSEITPELIHQIQNSLSLVQRISQKILGYAYIDHLLLEGWTEKIPFYIFKCEKHDFQLGYPHGHNMNLLCPDCLKERLTELSHKIKEQTNKRA